MRNTLIGIVGMVGLCVGGVLVFAQGEARRDPPAPTDKTIVWSPAELTAVAKELAADKKTTHRYFGEKNYNMEVRRLVGAQPILVHAKKSDFMLIQDGEGTYVSGGELVNGKAGGEDAGDLRGDSIRGGVTRVVKPGDVMFVPAGIPHGFVETKDHVTFVMIRFDTK